MADFDAFDSTPAQQTEEDPAADFLAREQDELKGLEDDNFVAETPNEGGGGDYDPFGSSEQPQQQSESPTQEDQAQQQYDFGGDFGQSTEETQQDTGPSDAYSSISQVDKLRAEPEQIRIWREENARRIEKKDEEEKSRVEEWRDIAKKELDDWYKHHDEQLSKTKENNRNGPESEAAFVADRDQTQPGEEWEKICRLCEFNPKNSKNTKDISKMRSILLQLKQTPLVR